MWGMRRGGDDKWGEGWRRVGGNRKEKIEITGLRQKMERADREKPPAHPPLQERKWSIQGRQNSKPPLSTPQRIHLMCVERRSAYFFFPPPRQGGPSCDQRERLEEHGGGGWRMRRSVDGKHEGWFHLVFLSQTGTHTHTQLTEREYIWLSNRCFSWMCNGVSPAEYKRTAFMGEKRHALMASSKVLTNFFLPGRSSRLNKANFCMSGAQSNNENFWSLNNSRLKMYSGLENDRGAEWKCLQKLCKICVKWIIRETLDFRFTVIIFYQPRCQNSTPEYSLCSSRDSLSDSVLAHCDWEM